MRTRAEWSSISWNSHESKTGVGTKFHMCSFGSWAQDIGSFFTNESPLEPEFTCYLFIREKKPGGQGEWDREGRGAAWAGHHFVSGNSCAPMGSYSPRSKRKLLVRLVHLSCMGRVSARLFPPPLVKCLTCGVWILVLQIVQWRVFHTETRWGHPGIGGWGGWWKPKLYCETEPDPSGAASHSACCLS